MAKKITLDGLRNAIKLINTGSKKGCRVASFVYRSKEYNSLIRYTVLLGVSFLRVYQRDISVLKTLNYDKIRRLIKKKKLSILPDGCLDPIGPKTFEIAAIQILRSLNESIRVGIGNNPMFALKGLYEYYSKGIHIRIEPDGEVSEILFRGYIINREVIERGEFKKVKSSNIVRAKNELDKKLLKRKRIHNFRLEPEHFKSISINGRKLTFK